MDHEHHQWLEDVNNSIVESYEREQDLARQPKNIQQAGHRVESRWEEVLADWLPPQYEIGKRKYILLETEDGPAVTKEQDLVVYYPHYPSGLRKKASVLASGLAAAFSVKRTITRKALDEAYEDGMVLRRGMKVRDQTVRHHLAPPVFFGLLGESHEWKSAPDPKEKIKNLLNERDRDKVNAPREGLDMLCIADLGYWSRSTSVIPEKLLKNSDQLVHQLIGTEAFVLSGMRHKYDDPQPLSPLTHFIGSLWSKLAINDPTLQPLADGLRITNTYPTSGGLSFGRFNLAEVTTPQIAEIVRRESRIGRDWMWAY
ncbi:hypothetical protein H7J87_16265 [Mycolicibacterium wolinskyi]|uniref:DUF6602 domain-containing protein n=1 Tax=Mycolicibacterium wolinskyi TaxID=59750 RepID=A0A1X2F7M6_9MYCO|nr:MULTISPECIES: DUF6602 domain-containing protein [Mycolicibacterium]MCV7286881.1 hypothetical protein [Mycolicibacterium wolinskyi]MCV7293862.1 hypothetical protein [Mycolicibacterium goodii]ORX14443.1 hypothetical protein AWC31_24895 [Mycolicibacterium wolinskyi]